MRSLHHDTPSQLHGGVLRGIKDRSFGARRGKRSLHQPSKRTRRADAIWNDMTEAATTEACLPPDCFASDAVSEIVLARSSETAAIFYASLKVKRNGKIACWAETDDGGFGRLH